ncbi:MAG: hypothetical protein AB7G23_19245 [Vicinamibacterales bacterium]
MTGDVGDFTVQLHGTVDQVARTLDQFVGALTTELTQRIIDRTPEATGQLKGAWGVGRNDEAPVPGIAAAGQVRLGDTIVIANPLPYAGPVEYGTHRTAPAAMVRTTLAELDAIAGRAAATVSAA